MKKELSIIIPVYNEENAILDTLKRIDAAMQQTSWAWEVIAVNDYSTDSSSDVLKTASNIQTLHHKKNKGYGAALKTGIKAAKFPWIAIIDADGTYDPQHLKEVLEHTDKNDMVVGSRTGDNVTYSPIRKIPKFFLQRYASYIANYDIPDMNSGLRVFKKDIAQSFFPILSDRFSFTTSITIAMLTNDYAVKFVPISYASRIGSSKIRPIRDTLNFCQLIVRTGMYFAPAKILNPIAFVFSLLFVISLLFDIFVIANLTDKTIILLMLSMNVMILSLMADMIQKTWRLK